MFPSPFEVRKEKFRWARFHTAIVFKGTINLERQHFLGGRGKKIGQICRRKRGGVGAKILKIRRRLKCD